MRRTSSLGMSANVSVRGHLSEPVPGTVTRTARALDRETRTLLAEVDPPNASHQLLPGMFVYVGLTIGAAGTRLAASRHRRDLRFRGHASRDGRP